MQAPLDAPPLDVPPLDVPALDVPPVDVPPVDAPATPPPAFCAPAFCVPAPGEAPPLAPPEDVPPVCPIVIPPPPAAFWAPVGGCPPVLFRPAAPIWPPEAVCPAASLCSVPSPAPQPPSVSVSARGKAETPNRLQSKNHRAAMMEAYQEKLLVHSCPKHIPALALQTAAKIRAARCRPCKAAAALEVRSSADHRGGVEAFKNVMSARRA